MHKAIRDRLEELLRLERAAENQRSPEVQAHLSSCGECAAELEAMRTYSTMLQSLRAPDGIAPAAGFYSRVLQRIEERAKDSIWSAFIYSSFGTRLAYASLTIAVLLGSYVVAQERRDGHLGRQSIVAANVHYDAPVYGDRDQQRNAVLENFAAH
jgi:predicted anti-sigma-YlaC factor YlaD